MATQNTQIYPIDTHTFSVLRESGYVYVDKTDLMYDMTHRNMKYVFLSRPRRFGKSLLLTTLKAYFEGRKELFEGLAIEKLEKEWTKYPVLHFSMSQGRGMKETRLEEYLMSLIDDCEKDIGIKADGTAPNIRLRNLTRAAYEKTGQKAVVLVDEYDTPLLDVMHEDEELPKLRDVMRNFYSPLKDLDPYLRFVFLTGITKFSQLSIFSALNNIKNISMDEHYAAICGITEEEMLTQLRPGIECLAEKLGLTYDGAVARLKQTYDGYHFCWPSPDIYNPYSLLNALSDSKISNYWFGTGTPIYLIEMLRKYGVKPEEIEGIHASPENFDAPTEMLTDTTPLLYQSGYLTINGYDKVDGYLLDIPNNEVREGLMKSLLREYVGLAATSEGLRIGWKIGRLLNEGRMEEALETVKSYLASISYPDNEKYGEGHFHSMLYVIFGMSGLKIESQHRTSRGRIDLVIYAYDATYIIEMKKDKTAAEALAQINEMGYADGFANIGLPPVVKIGININPDTRTINDWVIER